MSKKKVIEEPPKNEYLIPKARLMKVANDITKKDVSFVIVYNTLAELWADAVDDGYQLRIAHARKFKDSREKKIKESFDSFMDSLDDEIHSKAN